MRHARPDYERFQDPAAPADRDIYKFLGRLATVVEKDASDDGLDILTVIVDFFGARSEGVPVRAERVRAFAARSAAQGTPIGEEEPVFLIRGRDVCAPGAVRAYAAMAHLAGATDLAATAAGWAEHIRHWQTTPEGRAVVPDLPARAGG